MNTFFLHFFFFLHYFVQQELYIFTLNHPLLQNTMDLKYQLLIVCFPHQTLIFGSISSIFISFFAAETNLLLL